MTEPYTYVNTQHLLIRHFSYRLLHFFFLWETLNKTQITHLLCTSIEKHTSDSFVLHFNQVEIVLFDVTGYNSSLKKSTYMYIKVLVLALYLYKSTVVIKAKKLFS